MTTWVQFWQTFQEVFRYTWAHMVWINLVLAIIIIFFQRKEAKSAWAWLLALNVLPGLAGAGKPGFEGFFGSGLF